MRADDTSFPAFSELETLVDAWGLGLLEPDAAHALEVLADHSAALCHSMNQTLEAAAAIGAGAATLAPPVLRSLLAARLKSLAPTRPAAPDVIMEHAAMPWEATAYDGVARKLLSRNRPANLITSLISLQPGAVIPTHTHDRIEQCFVLEGALLWGDRRLEAGQFAASREVPTLTTATGCLLLVISPTDL